jgi:hypothetical protein
VRLPRQRLALTALAGAIIASAGAGVGVAVANGSSGHSSQAGRYGGLPGFLPRTTLRTDATVASDAARPAVTSQGDAVRATLPDGRSVLVTVSGPETPGEGLPFQAAADTATWTVTMSKANGPVPVAVSAFSAIDSLGTVYRPQLVPGQPRPPRVIRAGQHLRFELRAVMRVGEGDMRWAPMDNDLLGTWDFVVEND